MDECYLHQMMRTTIALDDDLTAALERYRLELDVSASVNAVVQAALREFLAGRGYLTRRTTLKITPWHTGSGHANTSIDHDRVPD
jgi:Arc/MetJ family transcription regulator